MTIPEIQDKASFLMRRNNLKEALLFAQKLETSLREKHVRQTNPDAYREISRIIFGLYLFCLSRVNNSIFHKVISLNIIEALSFEFPTDIDFIDRLELRYSGYPFEVQKEKIREECLPLLKQNTQLIGNAPIALSTENPSAEPSVKHWLEYYDRKTGLGETDSFVRSKFLSTDTQVQLLSSKEKYILRMVLSFYDYLQSNTLYSVDVEPTFYQDPSPKPARSAITGSKTPPKDLPQMNAFGNSQPSHFEPSPSKSPKSSSKKRSGTINLKKLS